MIVVGLGFLCAFALPADSKAQRFDDPRNFASPTGNIVCGITGPMGSASFSARLECLVRSSGRVARLNVRARTGRVELVFRRATARDFPRGTAASIRRGYGVLAYGRDRYFEVRFGAHLRRSGELVCRSRINGVSCQALFGSSAGFYVNRDEARAIR